MIDAVLQELYIAQLFTKQHLETVAQALDPAAKKSSLAPFSSLPADFIKEEYKVGDYYIDILRNDPKVLNDWYGLENGHLAGLALDLRQGMLKSESGMLGLASAIDAYYTARNEPVPEALKAQSKASVQQSEKRVSAFVADLDDVLEEVSEDAHTLTDEVLKWRDIRKTEYIDRLHKGYDAHTMHEYSRNMLATEYLNIAHAYFISAGLTAAVQILRLEADPKSFGNDDHQTAFRAMRNDLKHAAAAINFAKQASPDNAPENDAQTAPGYGTQKPN